MTSIKVAVTQAEAICLDLAESLKKAVDLPAEAAAEGAGIIAFPELWGASDRVVLGFAERTSTNITYIAQVLISSQGMLLIKRSMIKPTHVERTLFGEGSGDELTTTTELDFGAPLGRIKVSSMYFWEHTQPLLKHHTTSQGPVIHVSMWPPFDPNTGPEHPGLWNMTKEGCQKLSQTFLIGSAAYVLHATAVYSKKGIEVMNTQWGLACREPGGGHSCVIGRDGRVITEPSDGNADVKDLA